MDALKLLKEGQSPEGISILESFFRGDFGEGIEVEISRGGYSVLFEDMHIVASEKDRVLTLSTHYEFMPREIRQFIDSVQHSGYRPELELSGV